MLKRPAEVFGCSVDRVSYQEIQETERQHWCPFQKKECDKKSRLVSVPFGVCSVEYGGEVVAICPNRFWQNRIMIEDIAEHHFGTMDNLLLFAEVNLGSIGRLDYVIVQHRPLSSEVEDFVGVELQTVDTTSTGALVAAFSEYLEGKDISGESFGFGLNWANVWKRAFTQALMKGVVFEHWDKKLYFVAQEPAYQNLMGKYSFHDLYDMSFSSRDNVVFIIYDLFERATGYELEKTCVESATVDEMLKAIKEGLSIPSKRKFVDKLRRKVEEEAHPQLSLGI